MSNLKELKVKLKKNGYTHQWKLLKEKDITRKHESNRHLEFYDRVMQKTTKPLCQNIDLIVPSKNRTQNQQIQLEQFLNIIGTELREQASCFNINHEHRPEHNQTDVESETKEFKRNDDKRHFRIQEFIRTEKSYVDTLKTVVEYTVNPLRRTMQQKNCILNTFKCQKIFLNIDQILAVNIEFLRDLVAAKDSSATFGSLCEKHIIKFECYRKYLLEQSEAQKLHAKEYKTNQNYKRFISKVKDHPEFKRKRLQDILVEPVQRISRYSLMLREILHLTPKDHPDYSGLKAACEKAREIATMADDNPTKTATMFLNLYQAIKESPCSLINQKRSLIAHLNATEIHRVTNKPTRAVSIFLFTDKILVASQSSIDAKEIDLQQLLENSNAICPTSSASSSLLFSNHSSNNTKDKTDLKFKGWADIESVELFEGVPERPGSFILSATTVPEMKRDDLSSITSFEKYFYKGPRLFSVIPQRDESTSIQKAHYIEKSMQFRSIYQKTRALTKRNESCVKTYHKVWKDVPTFCNMYSQESYIRTRYKNDNAIIYVDDDQPVQTEELFSSRSPLFNPWFVGLIQPEEMKGFRFNICTKMNLAPYVPKKTKLIEQTIDFETIFWNNMIYLDECTKQSTEYAAQTAMKVQQGILCRSQSNSRSSNRRSRTKSISRTSSIPSIGKLFHNSSSSRSRSVSPSKMIKKTKSTSHQRQPIATKRVSIYHSWTGPTTTTPPMKASQYEPHGQPTSSVTTLASSLWSSSYSVSPSQQEDQDEAKERDDLSKNLTEIGRVMQTTALDNKQVDVTYLHGKKKTGNTLSSMCSDSSSKSNFSSMIDDFGDEEDEEEVGDIDYLTLNVKLKSNDSLVSNTRYPLSPTPVPTPPTADETLENIFKSMTGFEDEMQKQWKEIITKYELTDDEIKLGD